MSESGDLKVARVVELYQRLRGEGRRVSIDDALDGVPDVLDRAGTRSEALRAITRSAKTLRIAGSGGLTENGRSGAPCGSVAAAADPRFEPAVGDAPELEGYDLIEMIGRGGMGVVYEAYQRSTGRRVAVKLMLESAALTEPARRRFEREVELAAGLQHAGIVSVLDSGVHAGRYFYVMEYLEGAALDAAIEPGASEPRSAMKCVAEVCDAVDFAHQHGVLHRDLKPSNVLVDGDGRPHVLDFGLAKMITAGATRGGAETLSEPGQLLGTLGYMSPEQSRGDMAQLSVRSDVYSLGAIAYELVTGRLPCEVDGPLAEVLNRIAQVDPARPSVLRRGLSADLDAILCKALEKDAARRYATASELAADLRRYVTDQPVSARRIGRAAKVSRWIRRNKLISGISAAALIGVAAVGAFAFVRVAAERDRAREEARKAGMTVGFLESMLTLGSDDDAYGSEMTIRQKVDQITGLIESETAGQPMVEAAVRRAIGLTYSGLGQYEAAERELRRSISLYEKHLGGVHEETAESVQRLAIILIRQDRNEEALLLLERALGAYRALKGEDSIEVASNLNAMGVALYGLSRRADAEFAIRSALEIFRRRGDSADLVETSMHNMAGLLQSRGEHEAAELMLRELLANYRARPGNENGVAMALLSLGIMKTSQGAAVEAEPLLRESLELRRRLWGDRHPQVAAVMDKLGECLVAQRRFDEAEQRLSEALSVRRASLGERHPDVADTLWNLADLNRLRGDLEQAEAYQRESLGILRDALGATHNRVANCANLLAVIRLSQGDLAEAEQLMREVLRIKQRLFGDRDESSVQVLENLAKILISGGRLADAETVIREQLQVCRNLREGEHAALAANHRLLGRVLRGLSRLAEAEREMREAARIHVKLEGESSVNAGIDALDLATVIQRLGRADEAKSLEDRAVALISRASESERDAAHSSLVETIELLRLGGFSSDVERVVRLTIDVTRRSRGNQDPTVGDLYETLASVLYGLNRFDESEAAFRQALNIRRAALGDRHPAVAMLQRDIAVMLDSRGESVAAISAYVEAVRTMREAGLASGVEIGMTLNYLARAFLDVGDVEAASDAGLESQAILDRVLSADDPDRGDIVYLQASIAQARGALGEAEILYRRAVELWQLSPQANSRGITRAMISQGECQTRMGRLIEANAILIEACDRLMAEPNAPQSTRERLETALRAIEDPVGSMQSH